MTTMRIWATVLLVSAAALGSIPCRAAATPTAPAADRVARMGGEVTALAFVPHASLLLVGRGDGAVIGVDPRTLEMRRLVGTMKGAIGDLAFSPDGRTLAVSTFDGALGFWDVASWQPIAQSSLGADKVRALAWFPDSRRLAASFGKTVVLWDAAADRRLAVLSAPATPLRSLAVSPDGTRIAAGDEGRRIYLWDARTDRIERILTGHEGKVRQLVFLPGDRLASSSSDGTVRFWNLATGAQVAKVQAGTIGRNGKVHGLAFTPDHAVFLTGNESGNARYWRTRDLAPLETLRGHLGIIDTVAISPDGAAGYTGGIDGTLRMWRVPGRPAPITAPRTELPPIAGAFRDCPECPPMIRLHAGTVEMGSTATEPSADADEAPRHKVAIPAFAVGAEEVTWDEWQSCVAGRGCRPIAGDGAGGDEGWGKGDRPVIHVSWQDAGDYAAWLSRKTGAHYRLPSEAEWEYAARAGSVAPYSFGGDPLELCRYANGADLATDFNHRNACFDRIGRETAPVGSYRPNAFGLFDTIGNVWEWTADCWNPSYVGAPADGSPWTRGDCSQRVLRGGSWGSYPSELRVANRYPVAAGYRGTEVGFRVARNDSSRSDKKE